MARPAKAPQTERKIAIFADAELKVLVNKLRTTLTDFDATAVDVLGALVIAARGLPPTVVRELVALYEEEAKGHTPGNGGISTDTDR